ncbi:hypothetical protein SPBR_05019 [Sporothrix brasiliensis 5110]|uniref:3-carboxymuconate cyclase n=2 Tax=Sporothrix brasiliensis TaxID=545650 RepID=A0A0C2ILV0_9PEZI|nr:uncharacterized protein SPBR_05019 [Sporothrix brasiliensis 5110]AGW50712.1 carboxy-cis,cis-muconate cyclase [Sporothrix brasiliensis]KIH87985.1 hypothetical protein SPBR_05019 [Sporothrix brasiliensis 5110]
MHYYNKLKFLALASVISATSAHPTSDHYYADAESEACLNGKAVYVTSNTEHNSVVAIPIARNGSLLVNYATSTATGGRGGNGINPRGMPAGPDALFGQGSITIAGDYLFAVNAGSNTVTMLAIDKHDPTKVTVVGEPAELPGEFPTTVGASDKFNLVCVGLTGAKAGVSCASYSWYGLGPFDELRPFDLHQTTPPHGPTNTVSHVFFSGDQETVFTTVKGDPAVNNTGFLAAYPVEHIHSSCYATPSVSHKGVISSPEGTAVLFGSTPIPDTTNLFATDASFGAVILGIEDYEASTLYKTVIPGQDATCWVAICPATHTAFVTDIRMNRLVEMSLANAEIIGEPIDLTTFSNDPGLTEIRSGGSFVYALSPGNGTTEAWITVLNALTKKPVQHALLTPLGLDRNAMGMAILV